MLQELSNLVVADNTGVKRAMCFRILNQRKDDIDKPGENRADQKAEVSELHGNRAGERRGHGTEEREG